MNWKTYGKTGRCRIPVVIHARGRDHRGYVLRLFEDGLELSTEQVAEIWTGDEVRVMGEGFGPVAGTARWRIPRRLGVKLRDLNQEEAGLRDLWRFSARPEAADR
jgi:hypothetical protein